MANRRRGSGEGNIYQRPDGRWAARFSVGYRNGKRARRWIYGETYDEVANKLRRAIEAHKQGLSVAPARTTVGQFLQRWLDDCAKPKLRPRTFASYQQMIRLHIEPSLGQVPLQKLTPQLTQAWLNELRKSGLSPRTCQYARAILRSALGQALRWGDVFRNVATLVDPPRIRRHETSTLDPDQARALLVAATEHRLRGLLTVALAMGLRQGEALALKWSDVDLEVGTLQVRYTLQRIGKEWQIVEPKSERSRRTIALPDVVVGALRTHRVSQLEERLLAGPGWRELGLVFTTRTGLPLESRSVTKSFQKLLKRAGLPRLRFHDLRHTAATLLLAQGVDARTIMETLGHSQISLTLNTYSHVLPTLQRDSAEKMNRVLVG